MKVRVLRGALINFILYLSDSDVSSSRACETWKSNEAEGQTSSVSPSHENYQVELEKGSPEELLETDLALTLTLY
ncbi:hypothetical protein RRG08_033270 [Elysia crispata]|uniref:Uncharacterized protein n=1 Tax=Elysia crispata TaxID=231223 RepID=A0AAE0XS13_9GAST|nr:hypothetical protein RRG08_033270 [Elysia crispata]